MAGIASAVTPIGTVQSSRSARLALLAFRATSVAPTAPDVSPAATTAPLAEPGDESPGEQRHRCGDDRHRQQGEARVQRVQPAQSTEADRQAEDAPVQAEVEDEADRDDRREGVVPEDVGVDERPAHRSLDEHERRGAQDSGDPERERHARRPAVRAGADEPAGEGGQAEDREQLAGQIERPAPASRLLRVSRENPGGGEPDRDVHEEDRPPADRRHEDPSHEGAAGETDSRHGAPDGKRPPTRLGLREGVGDQGERARHQPRGTHALRDSRRDEERDGAGDGACCAGQDEHASARRESPCERRSRRPTSRREAAATRTRRCIRRRPIARSTAPRRGRRRSRRSATFTIVASSVIIKNPAEIAASASA